MTAVNAIRFRFVKAMISGGIIPFVFVGCFYTRSSLAPDQPVPIDWQKEANYYAPTITNVPMLSRQEDFAALISARFGGSGSGACLDLVGRVAPKWALMGGYNGLSFNEQYKSKFKRWELGGGYLLAMKENWNFEAFGGFGQQTMENRYHTGSSTINNNYWFVQPALYLQSEDGYVVGGLVSRFSFQYHQFKELDYDANRESYTNKQIGLLKSTNPIIAWEPGIQIRGAWKNVQISAQYFYITHLNVSGLNGEPGFFSLGLRVAASKPKVAAPAKSD